MSPNKKYTQHLLATLSWANDSLLGVNIGHGFKIEKWKVSDAVNVIKEFTHLDDHGISVMLDESFCLNDKTDHVYVISGKYAIEVGPDKPLYPLNIARVDAEGFGGHIGKIESRLKLIRLFKEGTICISNVYIYEVNRAKIEPVYSSERALHSAHYRYSLTTLERKNLNKFLDKFEMPFSQPYVQLAFDNFDQSYSIHEFRLSFLCLMIAAEVLFNDGGAELRYRIARGMAVLLGGNNKSCREIFQNMKKLYDMRSHLVHAGKF